MPGQGGRARERDRGCMVLSGEPTVFARWFAEGCHLNSSTSLTRCAGVVSTPTHTHTHGCHRRLRRGLWCGPGLVGRPCSHSPVERTEWHQGRREADPPRLASAIRNGFCYFTKASTAGFKPRAVSTTGQSRGGGASKRPKTGDYDGVSFWVFPHASFFLWGGGGATGWSREI